MAQQTDNNIEQGMKAAFDYFDKVGNFAKSQSVNEVKQTAVEWFAQWVNYHKLNQSLTLETLDDLTVKAKQMEKEQIINAFQESRLTHPMIGFKHETFKDYYNETYGNKIDGEGDVDGGYNG